MDARRRMSVRRKVRISVHMSLSVNVLLKTISIFMLFLTSTPNLLSQSLTLLEGINTIENNVFLGECKGGMGLGLNMRTRMDLQMRSSEVSIKMRVQGRGEDGE